MERDLQKQLQIIKRGAIDIFPEKEFEAKIKKSVETNTPLRVKLGVDPTSPDIHLGFTVVLRKLRQFQDLGHKAVLIIGDYTAVVGDPTGKSTTRAALSHEDVLKNASSYLDQVSKILDRDSLEVVYNGDWFADMRFGDVMKLASQMTVAQMLERDDFNKRYTNHTPISLHEFFYPLMQGLDSVKIKADIELGGTDQRFNILVGRDLQRNEDMAQQVALCLPILPGLDGIQKMSKSLGNYIGVDESPKDMYGKIMSIPDKLMRTYFELLTNYDMDEVGRWLDGEKHPKESKSILGKYIVAEYHSKEDADREEVEFNSVFASGNKPSDMPEIAIPVERLEDGKMWIVAILELCGFGSSGGERRRLIKQGAVKIDDVKIVDDKACIQIEEGMVVQAGKKRFATLRTS